MAISISTLNPTLHSSRASKEIDNEQVHPSVAGLAHKKSATDTLTFTAVSQVMSAASDYRDSLASLKKRADQSSLKVQNYGQSVATVKAKNEGEVKRDTGSFRVEVSQLATKMAVATETIDDATADLGAGTIKISSNTASVEIRVSGNAQEVADMINDDEDNTLVRASVEGEGEGARIVLHAKESGAEAAFSVNVTVTDEGETAKGLRVLNFHDHTQDMTLRTTAQDARATINGEEFTSATNEFDDVAGGITFQVTGRGAANIFVEDRHDSKLESDFANASAVFADRLVAMSKNHSEVRVFVEKFVHGDASRGGAIDREAIMAKLESEKVLDKSSGQVAINVGAVDTALKKTGLPSFVERATADPLTDDNQSLLEKLVGSLKAQHSGHAYGHDKERGPFADKRAESTSSPQAESAQKQEDDLRESVRRAQDLQRVMKGVMTE